MQDSSRVGSVLGLFTLIALVGCGDRQPGPAGGKGVGEALGSSVAALDTTLQESNFSNTNGWDTVSHYATIQYPDITGDARADVCGRGFGGVFCAVDDGTGKLVNGAQWETTFSDSTGWTQPQYYSTIQFPNVDNDANHRADVCARGIGGILCGLSNGSSFSTPTVWQSDFRDTAGWNQPQYYSTIRFPDVNGDGKADVCGRGILGITCALSSGSAFGASSVWSSNFSDAAGWTNPAYYSTIRFPDLNGDLRADVCGRGPGGIWCALANTLGTSFGTVTLWQSSFTDTAGWAQDQYNSTIQYSDIDGNGKDDLCAHGGGGIICALSTGSSFGAVTVWQGSFADPSWSNPQYYSTIRIRNGQLCARGGAGLMCAFSNKVDGFQALGVMSHNESDANGFNQPQYYKTFGLTADSKLMNRGISGIYSRPVFAPDNVSLLTTAAVATRRTALITKVWGTGTINTTQGIDASLTLPSGSETIDVNPLPSGTTVTRYKMNMPTSGGNASTALGAVVQGLADHFIPPGGSTKLIVINPGHACRYTTWPYQDNETVQELLRDGWAVLATYMPVTTPLQCSSDAGTVQHDQLFLGNLRPGSGLHPLTYFLDPVRRSLNYVLSHFTYNQVYMTGLSGGGWTTAFYAALDTRVTTSVTVAGGVPFYMRPQSDTEQEDYPAGGNDFFNFTSGGTTYKTGYTDLYVMGAYGSGRKQVQVLNRNDDCCFGQYQYLGAPSNWGPAVRTYETAVRTRVQGLGAGSFRVEINEADDPGFFKHEFSRNTRLSVILAELDGASPALGVGKSTLPFARGGNGHLWRYDGSTWTDSGLSMVGTPSIVTGAIAGHTYDVFYRDPANRPVHAYFNGTSWTATANISGVVINDPVAVSWGSGRIDVVAFGTDYKVYHWKYNGSWSAENVDPTVQGAGPMALTTSGANRLDIYFRGLNANLYHVASNGGPPFTVENTGGIIRGFPSATAISGTQWAYVLGTDDRLYQMKQTGSGAWSFSDLSAATGTTGTRVLGSPAAYRDASGNVKVYARINGTQVGVYSYNGTTWSFTNLGGVTAVGSPVANSLGAFILNPTNQSTSQFNGTAWLSLGGWVER
jgi:hypothetical protein